LAPDALAAYPYKKYKALLAASRPRCMCKNFSRVFWHFEQLMNRMCFPSSMKTFIVTMISKARLVLLITLLGLSSAACVALFSTFLSSRTASNGHSTFSSFASGAGESLLWRKISSYDRVAYVVIDALRSSRVQVLFFHSLSLVIF
jgi:hypothetical protein